jgi:hypothetical protein
MLFVGGLVFGALTLAAGLTLSGRPGAGGPICIAGARVVSSPIRPTYLRLPADVSARAPI